MQENRDLKISVTNNCLIREAGADVPETLICLAGYSDNGSMFLPLFETPLANRYRLLTIDLPGTGASPAKKSISGIEDFAGHIAAIIRKRGISFPGLIGHSIASAICVEISRHVSVSGLFSIEGNLTEKDAKARHY